MILITILTLAVGLCIVFNTTGAFAKAMEACATLVCYLGLIIFISLTLTHALRNGAKH